MCTSGFVLSLDSPSLLVPAGPAPAVSGTSAFTVSTNTTLNGTLFASDVVVDPGATLITDGYSIIVSGEFDNKGIVTSGLNPSEMNLTQSTGGSGGGPVVQSADYTSSATPGFSTIAPGGQAIDVTTSAPNTYGNPGSSAGSVSVSSQTVGSWYYSPGGIQSFISGAAGGSGESGESVFGSGGYGSYGLFIEAGSIIAGNISTGGQDGQGTGTGSGVGLVSAGGGGGGSILLAYSSYFSAGTYFMSGGYSPEVQSAAKNTNITGGEGGNGIAMALNYGSTPPVLFENSNSGKSGNSSVALKSFGDFNSTLFLSNATIVHGNYNGTQPSSYYDTAFDPLSGNLFIASGTSVTVVSTGSEKEIANVYTGNSTMDLAYDPINGDIFASNYDSGTVTVLNSAGKVVTTIRTGGHPAGMTYYPGGDVFAANYAYSSIFMINATTYAVKNITLAGNDVYPAIDVAYDANNSCLYVAGTPRILYSNNTTGRIYVYDVSTGSLVRDITTSYPSYDLFYDPVNRMMLSVQSGLAFFSSNSSPGQVLLIGVSTGFFEQSGIAVDPVSGNIYVTGGSILYDFTGLTTYYNVTVGHMGENAITTGSSILSFPAYDNYTHSVYIPGEDPSYLYCVTSGFDVDEAVPLTFNPGSLSTSSSGNTMLLTEPSGGLTAVYRTSARNVVIRHNTSLNSSIYAANITIESGVTVYSNGYGFFALHNFDNYGTIVTGHEQGFFSLTKSYGGSGGGGAYSQQSFKNGSSGFSTLKAGGRPGEPGANGSSPGTPLPDATTIIGWVDSQQMYSLPAGFDSYLSGAPGGFSGNYLKSGASSPGAGAYGIFIEGNYVMAGNIIADGMPSGGSGAGSGGGGGGSVVLAANTNFGPVNASVTGGSGTDAATSGTSDHGGSGGSGTVIYFRYQNDSPVVPLPAWTMYQFGSAGTAYSSAVFSANSSEILASHGDSITIFKSSTLQPLRAMNIGSNISRLVTLNSTGLTYALTSDGSNSRICAVNSTSVLLTINDSGVPASLTVDPAGGMLFASNVNGTVTVYLPDGILVRIIRTGYYSPSIIFDPHNGYIYAADYNYTLTGNISSVITVIDAAALEISGNITAGKGSDSLLYDPYNAGIYAADFVSGEIVAIGYNNTFQKTFMTGSGPCSLAYDQSGNNIFSANMYSGTLSEISQPAYSLPGWNLSVSSQFISSGNVSAEVDNAADTITLVNAVSTASMGSYRNITAFDSPGNLQSHFISGAVLPPGNTDLNISGLNSSSGYTTYGSGLLAGNTLQVSSSRMPYVESYSENTVFNESSAISATLNASSGGELIICMWSALSYTPHTSGYAVIQEPVVNGKPFQEVPGLRQTIRNGVTGTDGLFALSNSEFYYVQSAGSYHIKAAFSGYGGAVVFYAILINASQVYRVQLNASSHGLNWAASVNGMIEQASGNAAVFYEPNGTYSYAAYDTQLQGNSQNSSNRTFFTPGNMVREPLAGAQITYGSFTVTGSPERVNLTLPAMVSPVLPLGSFSKFILHFLPVFLPELMVLTTVIYMLLYFPGNSSPERKERRLMPGWLWKFRSNGEVTFLGRIFRYLLYADTTVNAGYMGMSYLFSSYTVTHMITDTVLLGGIAFVASAYIASLAVARRAGSGTSSAKQAPSSGSSEFEAAMKDISNGRTATAAQKLERLVAANPDNLRYVQELAKLQYDAGYDGARSMIIKAVGLGSRNVELLLAAVGYDETGLTALKRLKDISNTRPEAIGLHTKEFVELLDRERDLRSLADDILLNISKWEPNHLKPFLDELRKYSKKYGRDGSMRGIRTILKSSDQLTEMPVKEADSTSEFKVQPPDLTPNSSGEEVSVENVSSIGQGNREEQVGRQRFAVDLSDVNAAIIGDSASGKTVFLALFDLYFRENSMNLGMRYTTEGDIKGLRGSQEKLLAGEFPETTSQWSREKIRAVLSYTKRKGQFSLSVVDLPGDEIMGKEKIDVANTSDINRFISELRKDNLGFILTSKSLLFIIPAREYIPGMSPTKKNEKFVIPRAKTLRYVDFFTAIFAARKAVSAVNGGKISGILRRKAPVPVLIILSQWDIVRETYPEMSTERFFKEKMGDFFNELDGRVSTEEISLKVVGTGLRSRRVETADTIYFEPIITEEARPEEYIGIKDVLDWIRENMD